MATGKFERELRGVMSGDKEDIDSVTNTCVESTTEKHEIFKKYPFFVTRAAGSLGTDLLAVRGTLSFLIEVKAYKKDKIYLSDQRRLQKQREQIIDTATQCDIVPLYAYRLKGETGEKWSVFTLNIYDDLSNDNKDVMLDIPALTPTKSSHKMVWDEGLMLSDFAEVYERWMEV